MKNEIGYLPVAKLAFALLVPHFGYTLACLVFGRALRFLVQIDFHSPHTMEIDFIVFYMALKIDIHQ